MILQQISCQRTWRRVHLVDRAACILFLALVSPLPCMSIQHKRMCFSYVSSNSLISLIGLFFHIFSTLGQGLETSTFASEIIFSILVAIFGLILFALLIGNMQVWV